MVMPYAHSLTEISIWTTIHTIKYLLKILGLQGSCYHIRGEWCIKRKCSEEVREDNFIVHIVGRITHPKPQSQLVQHRRDTPCRNARWGQPPLHNRPQWQHNPASPCALKFPSCPSARPSSPNFRFKPKGQMRLQRLRLHHHQDF